MQKYPHHPYQRLTLGIGFILFGAVGGCDHSRTGVTNPGDDAGMGEPDLFMSGTCDANHPCGDGRRCWEGQCIRDDGPCGSDDDCENDSYCDCNGADGGCAGMCVPWGLGTRGADDPSCHGQGFPISDFEAPIVTCNYKLATQNTPIIMTPLVVDLDLDGKPEILFSTYENPGGALVAIHGDTCTPYFIHPAWGIVPCSQLAAADLDGDKYPEIVGIVSMGIHDSRVVVFNHLGVQLAISDDKYFEDWQGSDCSGVAIADANGDGIPELLVSGQVLRYHKGNPKLEVLWNKMPSTDITAHWGTLSLFADLDGDGYAEAVTGLKVFDGITGADKTPSIMATLSTVGAYPQVADFNGDGKPDILLVQSQPMMQTVSIIDYAHNKIIFGPYGVVGTPDRPGGWGGPATVADFDGDGVPDFGLSSYRNYYVYATKCALPNKPADCKGTDPGVLWARDTQDLSSGGTASSVFDFNGDGKAEVVYRDECWLRVMNGADGKTVFAQAITSGTALEMPVIADIDGDGHADLIVPSDMNSYCVGVDEGQTGQQFTGNTEGIFILRDPKNRWMSSRKLWNEHTYHITNVNDNLSIPKQELPNWVTYNNYRQNAQGKAGNAAPLPDFTGGIATQVDNGGLDCTVSERVWANLCNRGAATAPPGIPGAFYDADPRNVGAHLICATQTTMSLDPGTCESVFCDWKNPPKGGADIWFRADDPGGTSPQQECKERNDVLFMPGTQCYKPG